MLWFLDDFTSCKGIKTGFQLLCSSILFQLLYFQYFSVASGIPDSLSCIPDSRAQDSGFHKQNFLGFRNPDFLTWDKWLTNTQVYSIVLFIHTQAGKEFYFSFFFFVAGRRGGGAGEDGISCKKLIMSYRVWYLFRKRKTKKQTNRGLCSEFWSTRVLFYFAMFQVNLPFRLFSFLYLS